MKSAKPDPPFDFSMQVRTSSLPKYALDHVVSRLKKCGLEFKGKRITQEAVINATFLMLDAMPDEDLVPRIKPYVEALETMLGGNGGNGGKEVVVTPSLTKEQPSAAASRSRKRDA